MSDKSFGDHMSRGIVKNPLLSTAVTGLSIEDLTHNTVLLPVSRTQELFGRQEHETTPAQFTPTPSGDTFTPIHPPDQITQNKDDFDVNEYFARLQGTRYVSAPINTHIEDNTSIEKEENLEEINLNEPQEVPQSITADIAQNFSQLPARLPQVASAVFSSFSNMLMKRETPERQESGVSEMQVTGVPLVGVSEREVAPMKEPPVNSGPGNYRLTTKKKYAQIPGLSSGEPAQMPTYTPPTFNQPIFNPQHEIKEDFINTHTNIPTLDVGQANVDFNKIQNIPLERDNNVFETQKQQANVATSHYQDANPQAAIIPPPPMFSNLNKRDSSPNIGKTILPPSVARRIGSNKPTISNQTPAFSLVGNIFVPAPIEGESLPPNAPQEFTSHSKPPLATSFPSNYISQDVPPGTTPSTFISPTSLGASTTVPTIASPATNLPLASGPNKQIDSSITVPTASSFAGILPTAGNLPPPQKNVFVPPPKVDSHETVSSISSNLPPPPKNTFEGPTATVSQESSIMGSLPPPPRSAFAPPPITSNSSASSIISSVLSPPQFYTPGSQPQPVIPPEFPASPINPPPINMPLYSSSASVASSSLSATSPQPPTGHFYGQFQSTSELPVQSTASSPAAQQIYNPNQHVSLLSKNITDAQLLQMLSPVESPPKVPEPPKPPGNTNYRMTKKRPQYYSGPIEGVGAISNNVKPTITPVATTAFQGAVFTPETPTGNQATVFTPENVAENVSSAQGAILAPENIKDNQATVFTPENVAENVSSRHGAILAPENIKDNQQQFYNFTPVHINQQPSNINYSASESVSTSHNYNTSFDLSRQVPDAYEPPKQESAFGIIGSLKSKLSSIDINRLQNTVTTFFDPGYNVVKTETAENTHSSHGQNQGFEICVANSDTQSQPFSYDAHQNNFTYGQGSIPNASDYYNQQVHNVYSNNSYYSQPTYGTQSYSQTEMPVQQGYNQLPINPTPTANTEIPQEVNTWGSYDPNSAGYHKDNVADNRQIAHEPTHAVDTELAQKTNTWNSFNPTSTSCDKEIAAGNTNTTCEPTTAVDTESAPKANTWDIYTPTSTSYDNDIAAGSTNTTYGPTTAIDTDSAPKANTWDIYNPTSTSCDKDSAVGNSNITTDTYCTQIINAESTYVPTCFGDNNDNLTDNRNIADEQTSVIDTDSSQITNARNFFDAPGTSSGKENAAQNSSNTEESTFATNTKSSQKSNIWSTCTPTNSGYDKDNVIEHETGIIGVFTQGQLQSNVPNMVEMAENVAKAMNNLEIKDDAEGNLKEIGLAKEQRPIDEDHTFSLPAFPYLNDLESPYLNENGELKKSVIYNYVDMLQYPDMPKVPSVYIAPLDNPFSEPQEIPDGVSEGAVSWNSNEEEVDDESAAERLMALTNEESGDENLDAYESEQAENLDMGVTCREINQPEPKDEDLTYIMIKNIIAPIQLSNPVEVPLTETDAKQTVPGEIDTLNQCAEISLIADETIETLQLQSATELLDKNEADNEISYGWRAEAPLAPGEDLLDHDYTLKTNPNGIGLFANNNLFFDNMPKYDEIKTESNVPQNDISRVFQSQMSIPSAPPAEDLDDAKSDETGILDVLSIEQDASKDFPVFEEYVIEPSETDDDTPEFKNKIDEVKDTFTNRVDRFKKLEGNGDGTEQKDSADLTISNMKMPSYFDTGNYAVETHFKNSLTSPTIARIPPGFEDHYELMPTNQYQQHEPLQVPDTSTQTTITTTVSDVHTKTEILTTTFSSNMTPFTNEPANRQQPQAETKLPDFTSVFGANIELANASVTGAEKTIEHTKEHTSVIPQDNLTEDSVQDDQKTIVPTKELFDIQEANVEDFVQEKKPITLPDPINFFASSTREPDTTEGVNRLASYFASPAKTDNTKSFFELSQGQDHYRHNEEIKESKPFFELSQSQDHYKENITNMPHDRHTANLNLMNDLTSCQNIEPTKEQIVRTVNYFTVEYDNDILNLNKGEPSLYCKKTDTNNEEKPYVNKVEVEKEETIHDEMTEIVNKCKYCNDLKAGPVTIRKAELDGYKVKFRQAMDGGSSPQKEVNMEPGKGTEKSVSVRMEDLASDGDNSEGVAMITENRSTNEYEPVKYHWFYRVDWEDKSTWRGFSVADSRAIENAFHSPTLNENTLVPTDGGRYDVNVPGRLRIAVYWSDKPTNVRRCSWFYKGTTDARYVPYTEAVAEKLEVEYRHGITTGEWHRRLVLPNNELVVMHGPAVMVHFLQAGTTDAFSAPNLFTIGKRVYRNPPKFKVSVDQPMRIDHLLLLVHGAGEWKHQKDKIQSTMRPRVVRRGIDESEIEDTEPSSIDHLLLLCHGVGSACDMRFRAVEEVVDDFRATSLQLLQSHYRNSYDNGIVGRVEVLPISWHASLHSGPRGVDRRLARVTLASIPRLRSFTNDTVLDVLFYTSPHYCQMILDTVCTELNRIYTLFMARNPDFKGRVSLGGHSLGSVILYDLLCNQPIPLNPVKPRSEKTYISGTAANNPIMQYPTLCFEPLALYALGSPIAIFECIRGVDMLGSEFYLPTCRNFFNIFHPYDPIAYRIEPLVNPQLQDVKPSLIPHHKGRKRMHLELKDTMARVGADLKQKLVESIKNTWSSMWSSAAPPDHQLEKVVEEEIEKEQLEEESSKEEPVQADVTPGEMLGRLNNGRRVDYVLQEAPFEMINEYIFAMGSHVCYWESEDVMLLILREIYDSMGVQPDVTVPQQSMTVQRTTIVSGDERILTTDASTSRVS